VRFHVVSLDSFLQTLSRQVLFPLYFVQPVFSLDRIYWMQTPDCFFYVFLLLVAYIRIIAKIYQYRFSTSYTQEREAGALQRKELIEGEVKHFREPIDHW